MRRSLIALLAVVGLIAAACGDDGDSAGGTTETTLQTGRSTEIVDLRSSGKGGETRPRVIAQDNRFVAENVRVDPNARVRWRNECVTESGTLYRTLDLRCGHPGCGWRQGVLLGMSRFW